MTSQPPPTYTFTGIDYNPNYFNTDTGSGGSGFTQAQANLLYLKKTTPDTATSVETFNAGILTNGVDPIAYDSNMYIANAITTGNVFLFHNSISTGNLVIGNNGGSKVYIYSPLRVAKIDAIEATILQICPTIATSISLGSATIPTNVNGTLTTPTIKCSNIDTTISDTSLLIGSTTATNIYFGNTNTNVNFNGYTFFMDVAPNCAITANIDEEMPNKIFVDNRVAQSGSTQLFLNYLTSQTGIYKSLDTEIIVTNPTNIGTQQSGTRLIASFLTPVGYPNMTRIPRGIWKLNQYATLTENTGTIYYYFKVYKGQIGSFTQLGISGNSNNLIPGSGIYYLELYLAEQTILETDRILIEIYTVGTGVSDILLSKYQGTLGSPLSYITCPISPSAGSTLLSNNNTWTGTNNFMQIPTCEANQPVGSATTTQIPTMEWVQSSLTYLKTIANTWTGINSFSQAITIPKLAFITGNLTTAFYFQSGGGNVTSIGASVVNAIALTFTTAFRTCLGVIVSNNSASGNGPKIIFSTTAVTGSGFTLQSFNNTSQPISNGSYSYIAFGY